MTSRTSPQTNVIRREEEGGSASELRPSEDQTTCISALKIPVLIMPGITVEWYFWTLSDPFYTKNAFAGFYFDDMSCFLFFNDM